MGGVSSDDMGGCIAPAIAGIHSPRPKGENQPPIRGEKEAPMRDKYEFDAPIHELPDTGGAYIVFPWNLREEFGAGRV